MNRVFAVLVVLLAIGVGACMAQSKTTHKAEWPVSPNELHMAQVIEEEGRAIERERVRLRDHEKLQSACIQAFFEDAKKLHAIPELKPGEQIAWGISERDDKGTPCFYVFDGPAPVPSVAAVGSAP